MYRQITITHDLERTDWMALSELYRRAQNKNRKADDLKIAFMNSFATVHAYRNTQVIGAARAISDGIFCSTVVDVAVEPNQQGLGIGTAMLEALLKRLPGDKVYLTSASGREGFYERLGFRPEGGAMGLGPKFPGLGARPAP